MTFIPKNYLSGSKKKIGLQLFFISLNLFIFSDVLAQQPETAPPTNVLKRLSVEDLMNIEVTSVSKRPEKLSEVASAIQVITSEDIYRSGATNLPEALRLAPNLQVAQLNSYSWIISARGFNNIFSNKLLVLIDGRVVYTPLFAGVYWDVQNVLLEDIDRIEVISGPGGTLWGANAVNGVINIITKKAEDTPGLYISGAGGSFLRNDEAIRYGGTTRSGLSFRTYAQHTGRGKTVLSNGKDNTDQWDITEFDAGMDWSPSDATAVSLQANFYKGTEHTSPGPSAFDGQNVLARWTHNFSAKSDLKIQTYYDRTWRKDLPSTINDQLQTYDLDVQYHFLTRKNNNIVVGSGFRLMRDMTRNSTVFVGFVPPERTLRLFSGFVQDELKLVPDRLKLTLGTKLSHNVFTGFEIQPSIRMAWTPRASATLWTSVSRAVRTPSRIDVDYHIPTYTVPPGTQNVNGGPDFTSESAIAYELGYRISPNPNLSLSLAAFYNNYDDLYSVEALPGTKTYQIQNGVEGNSHGIELSGNYRVFPAWRLRGGYTYFHKDLRTKPGHTFDVSYAGSDPANQVILQSILDLPAHLSMDITGRYMGRRPPSAVSNLPAVPSYYNFDIRLGWQYKFLDISVTGQNLAKDQHTEFGVFRIPRNIYGKISCRF